MTPEHELAESVFACVCCGEIGSKDWTDVIEPIIAKALNQAVKEAVEKEREACAKMVDGMFSGSAGELMTKLIADKIRRRGE